MQPNDYVNAILVPEGDQVPLDVENLASQGIFHVLSISILLAMMVSIFWSMCYRITTISIDLKGNIIVSTFFR